MERARTEWTDLCRDATAGAPPGRCLYIQAGDPSDFDGYLIATAAATWRAHQAAATGAPPGAFELEPVVVIPERRAYPGKDEPDVSKHDPAYSQRILTAAQALVRAVGRNLTIVQGPLNERNVIPWKHHAEEHVLYGAVIERFERCHGAARESAVDVRTLQWLARRVDEDATTSVILDIAGSAGFMAVLAAECRTLGHKVRAAGAPIAVMAGIHAECPPQTLPVTGRDPRSSMNALYSPAGMRAVLDLARDHCIELLFTPNNVANACLRYADDGALVAGLGLEGTVLEDLARAWYRPHLAGRYVAFDWLSTVALLSRGGGAVRSEARVLYVPAEDASVLVLARPGHDAAWTGGHVEEAVRRVLTDNLQGTERRAVVQCVQSEGTSTPALERLARQMVEEHTRRGLACV